MGRSRSVWLFFSLVAVLLHSAIDDLSPGPFSLPAPVANAPASRSGRAPLAPDPGADLLATRRLVVPVQGVPRAKLRNNFEETRGKGRIHKALDIMAPWGTPVLAADDGRIVKISSNRAGGLALYTTDESGHLVYYYAHLAGYADGLREGQAVRRGDVVGYVGTTGNAPDSAPHLHFAVQYVSTQGRWWKGDIVNPYAALTQADGDVVAARP